MTPSRLFPPLRAAAFATADVRRAVPGMSVGILAVIAVLLAVAALLLAPAPPARADAGPGGVDVPDSAIGDGSTTPISPADRDFVVRVRLAGSLGDPGRHRWPRSKGVDPQVRRVGKEIAAQHVRLDALTRAAAARVGVALPDRPLYDQRGWLAEMRAAEGTDFDRVFVERLRAAHGLIFSAIAAIRAGTHNDVVRRLAQEANQFVMTHMTLLESTHLVDYAHDVPVPPNPPPLHLDKPLPVQARTGAGGAAPPVIWASSDSACSRATRRSRPHRPTRLNQQSP